MSAEFFGATLTSWVFDYVFYYPFFMAYVWMCGGIAHALVFEQRASREGDPLEMLRTRPLVTVIVPCRNEATVIREVIEQLMRTRYPNYEVIAVNDGSTDDTGKMLDLMALQYPAMRVVHNATNQGKAVALNTAALLAKGEYILGIDGDALVDEDAIARMLRPMLQSDQVGAVTGNPRVRTRTTLIGRMQVGEFSSTIGLIKRTQHLMGRLFTVSGVLAMFRREALLDVDFWSPDVMTEDIDVTWKLQLGGWEVHFEPRALCWILMPETLRGLCQQRQRWAIGGVQTLFRYTGRVINPKHMSMWPIYIEYMASVLWAYCMFAVLALAAVQQFLPPEWRYVGFLPEWHGVLLGLTCMLQLFVSLCIDRHYDKHLLRYFAWTIWYPLAFWTISMFTTVLALPITLLRRRGKRALWTSPERGMNHEA